MATLAMQRAPLATLAMPSATVATLAMPRATLATLATPRATLTTLAVPRATQRMPETDPPGRARSKRASAAVYDQLPNAPGLPRRGKTIPKMPRVTIV